MGDGQALGQADSEVLSLSSCGSLGLSVAVVTERGQVSGNRVSTGSVVAAGAVVVIYYSLSVTWWPGVAALWKQKLMMRLDLGQRPSVLLWLPSWPGTPGPAASEGQEGARPHPTPTPV